ncbi:LysR substrate-binding domain-containing protein [Photobacterium makurazakiensis]|uniref:LysR family transcriptional regulator n=1 Tax=Photobacterium makurazakiensis TaxID=2910234 RepID=UPI003D1393F3
MNPTPTMKELKAFLATAKTLSFTHAAKTLNVTQGAVSRQIIALEERLQVPLFTRHARGLILTDKGQQFLPLVEQAMNQIHQAIAAITTDKQTIKLKAPSCITTWLLPKLMAFQQCYPDIDVELTSAINHNINFASEAFSAGICYDSEIHSNTLITQLLFEEALSPMCAPSLLSNNSQDLSADQLCLFTWLHATQNQSDWRLWLSESDSGNTFSAQNQQFATLDLAVSAAIQGFGIAVGDVTLAQQDLDSGRLIMPHPLTVKSGKGYYLVCPHENMSHSLTLLFEWLQES